MFDPKSVSRAKHEIRLVVHNGPPDRRVESCGRDHLIEGVRTSEPYPLHSTLIQVPRQRQKVATIRDSAQRRGEACGGWT